MVKQITKPKKSEAKVRTKYKPQLTKPNKIKTKTQLTKNKVELQWYESMSGTWIKHKTPSQFNTISEAKKEAEKIRAVTTKKNMKTEKDWRPNAYGVQNIPPYRIKTENQYYPATSYDEELYSKHKEIYQKGGHDPIFNKQKPITRG